MYAKILVPLDGSKTAEIALPHAETLASQYNAKLVLLSVISPLSISGRNTAAVTFNQRQIDDQHRHTERYLKGVAGQFEEKNIDAEVEVVLGPTVQGIIQTAENKEVDLVVIASHGHTGLKRVFFGSTAAGVLNRIEQPLMVIRNPQ